MREHIDKACQGEYPWNFDTGYRATEHGSPVGERSQSGCPSSTKALTNSVRRCSQAMNKAVLPFESTRFTSRQCVPCLSGGPSGVDAGPVSDPIDNGRNGRNVTPRSLAASKCRTPFPWLSTARTSAPCSRNSFAASK